MVPLFAITIFVGSALLFLLQPMFARMVLPLLGGSPSVWNTAMVFYQAMLLVGYAYAHVSTARLGPRWHAPVQIAILLVPLAVLPVAIPAGWTPPSETNPVPWLLALMAVAVGLPFFVVATMSPVLQKWFSASGDPRAADPYFLYSASNLGSMAALLSYPLVFEPRFSLVQQARSWAWGYVTFVGLAGACAVWVWNRNRSGAVWPQDARLPTDPLQPAVYRAAGDSGHALHLSVETPATRRRLRWVVLSFVPSSLMLGVTSFLSSEIAVVPLLWIVPLALYLLTFVLAFREGTARAIPTLGRAFSILIVTLVVAINMQANQPLVWLMLLHLVVFTLAALSCHTRLAADRPSAAHLTEFYLWLSVGGVLGGIFNALVAPLLFDGVIEYPLVLVLAALLVTHDFSGVKSSRARLLDWLAPLAVGATTIGLVFAVQATRFKEVSAGTGIIFGIPALICFLFSRRPLRFALGLGALFVAGNFHRGEKGKALHTERSFFGVHRVTVDPSGRYHLLVHGRTLHGTQSLDPALRREPLAYYFRTGPAGQILLQYGGDGAKKIGVVGLGAGSLSSYAQPRQAWTIFEIDPVVVKLARDERYFTFLRDSPGNIRVVLGDARLSLARESSGSFDLLMVDAFSSDAIPVHLITREALALYKQKLTPHGLLAFHISNLHLDLEPVLAALAHDSELVALVRDDTEVSDTEHLQGKQPSVWLVMAHTSADLAPFLRDSRWRLASGQDAHILWTDDYSSLFSIFRSR